MGSSEITFRLNSIRTEQFAIIEDIYNEGDIVNLESGFNFGSNFNERIIAVSTKHKFISPQGVFLIAEVCCVFLLNEDSWLSVYNTEKSILTIPKGLATHLLVLTIGTARGVLHAKTENTPYNRFFLPTLNVSEKVKEDVVINK